MANLDLGPHDSFRPPESRERVPINIAPEVRERLRALLTRPEFQGTGVGYSAFINRACELAETTIAHEARAAEASARGQAIALGLKAQEFEARNCQCWNEGQYGRVHREDCPIHRDMSATDLMLLGYFQEDAGHYRWLLTASPNHMLVQLRSLGGPWGR